MKQTKENENLLKKARRAVWLNRYLRISIPATYEKLIINQECCDGKFMRQYISKNKLLMCNEEAFLKMHLKDADEKKLQLVQEYVVYHGALPSGQLLIVNSKDVELIVALITHYAINGDGTVSLSALKALVKLKDPELLYDVLSKQIREQRELHCDHPQDIWPICFEEAVKLQDVKMLDVFSKLRFEAGTHFTAGHENYLFYHGTDEMIFYYLKHWQLFAATLEDLTDGHLKYDKWEEVLQLEIERRKLPPSVLMNLVRLNANTLLKKYFVKYGLAPEVMAYYANQKQFCKDLGIDG